jgi:hypothetical protein
MAKKLVLSNTETLDASHHTELALTASSQHQHATDLEHRQDLVSKAAYFIAEQRNFVPGNEMGDWLAAEADIFGLVY